VIPGRPNLAPEALLKDLTSLELRPFLASHGDAPFLLVRVPPGDTNLELGLDAGTGRASGAKPLPFRTTHQAVPKEPRRSRPPKTSSTSRPPRQSRPSLEARKEERLRVANLLTKHAYVAVPLHKRGDSDVAFSDRISVGRAQNKDIVLRHPSISKFHAWFEVDPSQTVHVYDSGSTNRTQVNGRPIEPKTSVAVASGDLVQFGAVEALLCSPETLWWCLNRYDDEQAASK
jgi:hypothetical protein